MEYKIRLGINDVRLSQLIKEYSAQLGQIRDYAYFDKEDRKKFLSIFADQNEQLARKYLDKSNGILFENIARQYSFVWRIRDGKSI